MKLKDVLFFLTIIWCIAGKAQEPSISLPDETVAYKTLPGVDLANGYCLTCHSADYVTTQPPSMGRSFWLAEVKKMQQVFGAPIPDDQIAPLTDYLVRAYGDPKS